MVAGANDVQKFNCRVQLQVPMWCQRPGTDTYIREGSTQTAEPGAIRCSLAGVGPFLSVSALGMMQGYEAVILYFLCGYSLVFCSTVAKVS